jgi:tRNA(Ile)-lysidine synthase
MVKRQGNQEPLEERILGFIKKYNLLADQSRLVAGVSGGPDSVCLFHILVKLQEKLNFKLHSAHLDHRLRGADSKADAQYVQQLANDFNIPAVIEQRDVKKYQEEQHIPLEEAAREVRYSFFSQVAKSIAASHVAVGHTADDQVETILMHLVRGTGTRGLRGLKPSTSFKFPGINITVIRPLLGITREEVLDYCRDHNLKPRFDTTNLSLSPLRNRIRHQLIPLLQSFNPRINEALLRMAEITGDDLSFLDSESLRLWNIVTEKENDTISFNKTTFLELPLSMQRTILRTAMETILGNIRDIEARHIEEIIDALDKPAGKRLILPRDIVFSIEYDRYLLGKNTTNFSSFPPLKDEYILNIPGETVVPDWKVTADVIDREQMTDRDGDFVAFFDIDRTGRQITVRSRREGDRFQPLGMIHSKKLGEFMIDEKIPNAWRDDIPIVCSPQQIVWVVGWRIDNRVKITDNTKQVLRLEFERG